MIRLGILGSTRGTHLQTIIDAIVKQDLPASIELVISNKSDAGILQKARLHQLQAMYLDNINHSRESYDAQISHFLKQHHVDFIILIGYMRILSEAFVAQWQDKIINVHPSLLPAYAGMMDLAVHQAVLADKQLETGCTVHYVTKDVDAGPILLQKKCQVHPYDTAETLKAKVQELEGLALIETIKHLALATLS